MYLLTKKQLIVHKEADLLSGMAEQILAEVLIFDDNSIHSTLRKTASDAALQIGKVFEQAIADNVLSEAKVFDKNYQLIQGSNPPKYTTTYDKFTDHCLPSIQEPLLTNNKSLLYAGAVDVNGYFPTHNKKFSHPQTVDFEKDLVNSRSKRIFDDPTGSRCGSNTEPFLLQTYKRDTGEVMHDLSVPIYVKGKHWGGFRMGYKAT